MIFALLKVPYLGALFKLVLYTSAQRLDSTTRLALSGQKMEIFDKDFKQLFVNNAALNQLLY